MAQQQKMFRGWVSDPLWVTKLFLVIFIIIIITTIDGRSKMFCGGTEDDPLSYLTPISLLILYQSQVMLELVALKRWALLKICFGNCSKYAVKLDGYEKSCENIPVRI